METGVGRRLHYDFGFYNDGMSFEDGLRAAVRRLVPFLDTGSRILDIGCGWGGPARELRKYGYEVLSLTNSTKQHAYCVSLGLQAKLLDAESEHLAS
jgi:cyclopropane fatty-acyl-phospholipid synthase-like methyltransferase